MRALSPEALDSLAAALQALTADVAHSHYSWAEVDVGWLRPHGELVLVGPGGQEGRGELVAFTAAEHRAFAGAPLPIGPLCAGALPLQGHAHCALEAAVLDLALRQRGLALADLVPGTPDFVHVGLCRSFERVPNPAPHARLKIDHQPGASYAGLDLAVLDYKGKHTAIDLPGPIFEDPTGPCRAPWSWDQRILTPADVASAVGAGVTHINLKAGRMGGFIATVLAAAQARRAGLGVYWGGMWELGVGRRQALQLAALVCPEAANDLAPLGFLSGRSAPVSMRHPGFGPHEQAPSRR